jgi:hypothetical protein
MVYEVFSNKSSYFVKIVICYTLKFEIGR